MNAEQTEAAIIDKIGGQISDLLKVHWPKIVEIRDNDEESQIAISISTGVVCAGSQPVVKTRICYAQKFKDEIEERIDDPKQEKFKI